MKPFNKHKPKAYVYMMTVDAKSSPTKVGFSTRMTTRIKQAQTYHHKEVSVPYKVGCKNRSRAKWLERIAHKELNHLHIMGEWFDADALTCYKIVKNVAMRCKDMSADEMKMEIKRWKKQII
jgi:hypothetical protein